MAANDSHRLPVKSIAARYLNELPSLVSLLLAGLVYVSQPQLWPGPVALVLIGSLCVLRLISPIYAWATVRYEISAEYFSLTRGLALRSTRTTAWTDISVVTVDFPWAFRQCGLGIVSLRAGGQDDTKIDVSGLDQAHIEAITLLAKTSRNNSSPPTESTTSESNQKFTDAQAGPAEPVGRAIVFTARMGDIATANLIYGHVFVLGASAILAIFDAVGQIANLDGFYTAFGSNPWIMGILLFCLILLGGSTTAIVKYYGFTVTSDDRRLTIKYGWISTNQRDIDTCAIGGIRARRNLIEMVFDRVRISLLTTDSDAQMGTNLVFPSMPRNQVKAVLESALPELPSPSMLASSGRHSVIRSLGLIVLVGVPTLCSAWLAYRLSQGTVVWAAVAAVAVWITVTLSLRLARAKFTVHEGKIIWASHAFIDHEATLTPLGVHLLSSTRIWKTNLRLTRVHYFAGRPRMLSAFNLSSAVSDQVADVIITSSATIANTRRHSSVMANTKEGLLHP